VNSLPRSLVVWTIRGYQRLISRNLPPMCRFTPSCSAYAVEAVQIHGVARGSWLALRRIGRCHPLNPGGYDPVPPAVLLPPGGTGG
jgi:putative membrane protein insertion efficiency factor